MTSVTPSKVRRYDPDTTYSYPVSANQTEGTIVHVNASKLLVDADASTGSTLATGFMIGDAYVSSTDVEGQWGPMGTFATEGLVECDASVASTSVGRRVYLSDTAGDLADAPGTVKQDIGYWYNKTTAKLTIVTAGVTGEIGG